MAAEGTTGNPAAVGLAGFGITTLLLQFHNLGLCGSGVVFCTALFFGGGAQLIAGFQEFKAGNNFGYSAFTAYGAFWMALAFIFLDLGLPPSIIGGPLKIAFPNDVGYFLLAFIPSLRVMAEISSDFIGRLGLGCRKLHGERGAGAGHAIDR